MLENFLKVEDVAEILGISNSYAYKIIRTLNADLDKMGYITVSGKVNKQYFMEKVCYGSTERKG